MHDPRLEAMVVDAKDILNSILRHYPAGSSQQAGFWVLHWWTVEDRDNIEVSYIPGPGALSWYRSSQYERCILARNLWEYRNTLRAAGLQPAVRWYPGLVCLEMAITDVLACERRTE